ncbi:unnamed protein product, partial [Polarella glacialis]
RLPPSSGGALSEAVAAVLQPVLASWRLDPRPATRCLAGLARARASAVAVAVLRALPELRVEVNVIHFNTAISACEKAGQWEAALSLLSGPL